MPVYLGGTKILQVWAPGTGSEPPVVTLQPLATTATDGSTFTMTCAFTSGNALTYQWSEILVGGSWANIAGQTTTTLTHTATAARNNAQYRCIATDTVTGLATATTNAPLTVSAVWTPADLFSNNELGGFWMGTAEGTRNPSNAVPVNGDLVQTFVDLSGNGQNIQNLWSPSRQTYTNSGGLEYVAGNTSSTGASQNYHLYEGVLSPQISNNQPLSVMVRLRTTNVYDPVNKPVFVTPSVQPGGAIDSNSGVLMTKSGPGDFAGSFFTHFGQTNRYYTAPPGTKSTFGVFTDGNVGGTIQGAHYLNGDPTQLQLVSSNYTAGQNYRYLGMGYHGVGYEFVGAVVINRVVTLQEWADTHAYFVSKGG